MKETCVLAIDLGTTNCKALLLDAACHIVDKVSIEYSVSVPRSGWAEQQPEDWWAAAGECIRRLTAKHDAESIVTVGLTGQMHGLVVLDARGRVIRPAILWNDQRSSPQCEAIYRAAGGRDGLLAVTSNAMLPGYTGGKILWLRDNEPESYARISRIMLPKDYIRYRLTGQYGTDVSDASGTGLFDVRERRWAEEFIERLGIPLQWFPHAHGSWEVVGEVSPPVAGEVGLLPHTPVIAGGGDAVMQTVGGGAVDSDAALVVIGTGGNVTVSLPAAIDNPGGRLQIFCHVLPGQWVAMGVTLSAGSSLQWYRDTLGQAEVQTAREMARNPYDLLCEEAASVEPGADGLLFLPYLQGERCPHVDVDARGVLVGLGLRTRRASIVRSIIEGVTFSLRDVLELIEQAGFSPQVINTSGGGSASELWRQVQADVFNKPVTMLDYSEDAGAVGAAILAGVHAGFWTDVRQAISFIQTKATNQPVARAAQQYDKLFGVYRGLYLALKLTFEEIAAWRLEAPA